MYGTIVTYGGLCLGGFFFLLFFAGVGSLIASVSGIVVDSVFIQQSPVVVDG